ncbi:hypothetical protein EGT50_07150 [Rhodococcus xishaensis]|uniref:Uncharacterized protein n=1 Tax=Rhodococcus xishaensis TaxID=2487364 RepID=A0A3S3E293_9NOCA|nr:hypothetical protein EGT50_07150 [Rhodococcus xishaensis]
MPGTDEDERTAPPSGSAREFRVDRRCEPAIESRIRPREESMNASTLRWHLDEVDARVESATLPAASSALSEQAFMDITEYPCAAP